MTKTLFIGGFVVGEKIAQSLLPANYNYQFIDVNHFAPPFSLDSLAVSLATELAEDAMLIAYSCGGLLALKLLENCPHKIRRLILVNSTPRFIEDQQWQGISRSNYQQLQRRLARSSLSDFMLYFVQMIAHPQKITAVDAARWASASANQATLAQWLEIIAHSDLRTLSHKFTQQISWLNAASDVLIPNSQQNPKRRILNESTHLHLNQEAFITLLAEYYE